MKQILAILITLLLMFFACTACTNKAPNIQPTELSYSVISQELQQIDVTTTSPTINQEPQPTAIHEENLTDSSIEGSSTIDNTELEIKDIDSNSAESTLLQNIGKTYSVLKKEHPNAVIQDFNLGGAVALCLVDSKSNYSYYFFGTQDFPFENYAEKYKDQFRCSGLYTTTGVYFPMTNDMLIVDFFASIGVTDYDYYTGDNSSGWGWFRFKYKGLEVNLDGSKDSFDDNDNFKPLASIKRSYPVIICDPNIEDQNQKLIEDIYIEQNYNY